jgi:hypothetical protein
MTRRQAIKTGFVALLLVFATAACATGRRGADGEAVQVRVINDLTPPTSLTVWMVPATGVRTMLGTVAPSETKVLRFEQSPVAIQYRLVGEMTAGNPVASRPFSLADVAVLERNLFPNTVTVVEER